MQAKLDQYTTEINKFTPATAEEVESFRIKFLGSKGIVKELFDEFKSVGPEEKRVFGKVLNEFKQVAEAKFEACIAQFEASASTQKLDTDLTLPGEGMELGARHPLQLVRREIVEIFKKLGFTVAEGP